MNYNEIIFKRKKKESKFVDFSAVKKYGRFQNMIVSGRQMGKTLGAKKDLVLETFFEKGYQTKWIRRFATQTKEELNEPNWFGDALELFANEYKMPTPDVVQEKDGIFTIGGRVVCSISSLTEAVNLKGPQRKGIATVIFDEFIEKDYYRYISPAVNEPTNYWLKTINTLLRDRSIPVEDLKTYLLSNAEALANPYFEEFDLVDRIHPDTEFLLGDNILLYLPRMSLELYDELMKNPMYQIISETSYKDVAIDNRFFDSSNLNIEKSLYPTSKPLFSVRAYNTKYNVYTQGTNGEEHFYITKEGNIENGKSYAIDINNIKKTGERIIPKPSLEALSRALSLNMVTFKDIGTRSLFSSLIKTRSISI